MSEAEAEWMRGYNTARSLCLRHGVEPDMPAHVTTAYESGFSWAVYDWRDANGLPGAAARGA
ncbi:MAG: hypothetical protein QM572_05820 [Nocardioides sp.]|uniref:hypothetical protein n=1 Tax=Nocardioides sp. TaxID=35761 RepID=UPI0039E5ABEF